jgi:polysaccharide biosynthesis transport protein
MTISSYPEENSKNSTIDVQALMAGLRRRWKLILVFPVLLTFISVAGLRMIPPRYDATVSILIFDPQWQAEVPGEQRMSLSDFDTVAINTEMQVIISTRFLLRVARELRLDQNPEFQQRQGRIAALLERFGLSKIRGQFSGSSEHGPAASLSPPSEMGPARSLTEDRRIEQAAAILRDRLRVDRVPLSYVLLVSATCENPTLAQRVAAQTVDDYLADQRETRQKALQEMALWLKDRLTELKTRVVDTETAIEKLKAQSGLSDTGKGNIAEQQVADVNAQLMLARADVADKRARLEQARQLSDGNNSGVLNVPESAASPLMGQLRLQQSELMLRDEELRAKLGAQHAEVLALDTQLAGFNKAIYHEAAHTVAQLQSSLDIAVRREQSTDTSLQQLTAKQSNSGDVVKIQELKRIADADSKLYESYLGQYNEIGTRVSLQVVGARIISPAELPTAPSFPRHQSMIYLGAAILGLLGGTLLALMLEYFQPRVSTSTQAEQMFGQTVVGALPLMAGSGADRNMAHTELVEAFISAPLSPLSEAVRTIRIGLGLSDRDHVQKVILVTSCVPGEGKSAVASLLAASSTSARQKTVLVDCDLRGRAISRNLGKEVPGLGELLAGNAHIEAVTIRDAATGCCIIPAGRSSEGPSDLLASRKMKDVIERLKKDFDYIVLDTPPLLSVIDALTLAPMADRILLTVDIARTRHDSIVQALKLLRPEAERVAGMVFNRIPPNELPRYRFSGYYPT